MESIKDLKIIREKLDAREKTEDPEEESDDWEFLEGNETTNIKSADSFFDILNMTI